MKKQIFTFTLFVLAVLAGLNQSFGQTLNTEVNYLTAAPTYCAPAVPLDCVASAEALHPLPGENYNYSITVTAGSTVHWFVTDQVNVIASAALTTTIDPDGGSGKYILDAEDGVYNTPANTTTDIDISWKSFDGITNTVLLVAYALDASGCTNNIEVYKIEPMFGFTLDIAGLLDDGTSGATECVSPVQSATYDAANSVLNVDYGENYIFFTVNAANWVHSWQPDFTSTYAGSSTISTIEWAYPDEANDGAAANWHTDADPVLASHYGTGVTAIGASGECIVLRVSLDHGTNELIADETVTVGVDGYMYDPATTSYPAGNADLDEPASGTGACVNDITDEATYTITARPDINASSPTPFETKVGN